jgi:hypothetical protein
VQSDWRDSCAQAHSDEVRPVEKGDQKIDYLTFKNIIGDKYHAGLENSKQLFGFHSCVEKENSIFVF